MADDRRSPAELTSAAVHDVRGSLGSIRLAVTSLLADDDDAEFRKMMLDTVELETRRLDVALTGLQALTLALTDRRAVERVALGDALRAAAADAARRDVVTDLVGNADPPVVARPDALRAVLAALLAIVGNGESRVVAACEPSDGGAAVRMQRADGGPVMSERALVDSLLGAISARAVPSADALVFDLSDDDRATRSRR
jgi:hypothetical protein